jgi:hypothetical protein
MNPLFVANPEQTEVADALRLWPELAGKRIRPLFVSAFGDIFVEIDAGDVWVASPMELTCERVAGSAVELERLFANPAWTEERLLTEVALLASERDMVRPSRQVFAIAPHPTFTGSIRADQLRPMDLAVWHHIATQLRLTSGEGDTAPG